jgi:hypothetical protein
METGLWRMQTTFRLLSLWTTPRFARCSQKRKIWRSVSAWVQPFPSSLLSGLFVPHLCPWFRAGLTELPHTFQVGSVLFTVAEKWPFGMAVYFCFVTFTTVGYGTATPSFPLR